jgi:UDP-N-acetyl-D-mannosaminuronic acid dehydrogenase
VSADPRVAVVGQGKLGVPLAVQYALAGLQVTGCDVWQARVDEINAGRNPIAGEAGLDEAIARLVGEGRYRATTDTPGAVREADVAVVIVPLLAVGHDQLDFANLEAATDAIAAGAHDGMTVIYETTLPVGTTSRFAQRLSQKSGLELGTQLFVAFSPERVYSGRILADLATYPKIVGGIDPESGTRARAFYRRVLPEGVEVVEVGNAEAAELVKLAETTYRDINIAYANELARYADTRGIEIDEVIRLANTQPFSHIHDPGAGVGGHCIPHYPHFLLFDDAGSELIRLARTINDEQPAWVAAKLGEVLGGLEGKAVLILGVSYRENVRELTSSPGVDLVELLASGGVRVFAHDPHFTGEEIRALGAEPASLDRIGDFDAVVLQAAHNEYAGIDWSLLHSGEVVFDGRNALDPDRITSSGAWYLGVGRSLRKP